MTKCLISRMKRVVTFTTCLFLSFSLVISSVSSTCPKIIEGRSPSNGSCLESCQTNKDCSGSEKCCPTSCGGHICTSGGLDVRKNECEVIVCGANAECVLDSTDSPSLCKCRPGFSGDPNDPLTGCTKSSKLKLMCDYKNKSYGIEESFFDGCELKCVCTEALEVDCTPRCPLSSEHNIATSDPLCSLIEDPKDSCCKIVACESRSVFQTTPLIDPVPNVSSLSTSVSSVVIDVGNGTANTIGVNEPLPSDGCRSQNGQFYKKGDTFFEGCDSKCSCRDSGDIQCEPRCSLFQGFDGTLCQLISDPSDPECCKIAICDTETHHNVSLVLDSVEVRNSSTIRIKVVMDPSLLIQGESNTSSSIPVVKPQIDLLLSRIDEELHDLDHGEENKLEWIRREVDGGSMRQVGSKAFEFEVSSLKPATEYLMKITRRLDNLTSNTVLVRTFPPGIDSSFSGCFHGNKTYEVGQIFFDGCAYKCTCREGGLRECEERCPVYVDTVGYENCVWKPAPDDPCCTIPVCDRNHTKSTTALPKVTMTTPLEPFCTFGQEVFTLGQTWHDTSKCIKKTCTCVLLMNGTTAVQCSGGCAEIPQAALKPTIECPKPSLVTPDDQCLCPYVICHKSRNPISPPPRLPNSGRSSEVLPKKGSESWCDLKGRKLAIGEEAYDGCRAVCHCGSDGELNCALIECPHHFDPRLNECMEWDNDPDFEPTPPNCCPRNKCKPEDTSVCHFGGLIVEHMKEIPQEILPCGTRCICISGNMTCENKCPNLPEIPPPSLPCQPQMAHQGHLPGDSCCLHWLCRNSDRPVFCERNGIQYNLNQEWDETTPADGLSISTRRKCHCRPGSGSQPIVHCGPAQCPQITERHLRPSPECPIPFIVTPDETGVMCPYVICNHSSEETGKSLDHVSVIAMNGTSVRVRFTLPQILVGLVGHAELVFTTQPTLPRHEWNVQKFARPKRLFDTPNIEYHLSNLKPDTTYYFQIRIIVEALQSGPESEIYKLRMPSEPVTVTMKSTTSPSVIVLDVKLSAHHVSPNSIAVSWRPLEPTEKKIVDGLQVKYKRVDDSEHHSLLTPMIHRDLTGYTIRDLKPGSNYLIDVIFKPSDALHSSILSSKPLVVEMPVVPRDDFEFHVSIDPLNDVIVDSTRTLIHLRGVPKPANKYITVVKISFKSSDSDSLKSDIKSSQSSSSQITHSFKVPSDDGTVVLDNLKPGRRYKAWTDIYLSNGNKISSNVVEFMTKHSDPRTLDSQLEADNEALSGRERGMSSRDPDIRPYYVALTIVALFASVTGVGFVTLLCVLLRSKSSSKAPITRAPSESAYDNPTYKTYDNERPGHDHRNEPLKNGHTNGLTIVSQS